MRKLSNCKPQLRPKPRLAEYAFDWYRGRSRENQGNQPANGLPQFGQNFGGLAGSGAGEPQFAQTGAAAAAGFLLPQFGQNAKLPSTALPQFVQVQVPTGAGFFSPQNGQNANFSSTA